MRMHFYLINFHFVWHMRNAERKYLKTHYQTERHTCIAHVCDDILFITWKSIRLFFFALLANKNHSTKRQCNNNNNFAMDFFFLFTYADKWLHKECNLAENKKNISTVFVLLSYKDSSFSRTQSVCVAISNMHIHMYEFSENKLNEQNNFHFIIIRIVKHSCFCCILSSGNCNPDSYACAYKMALSHKFECNFLAIN